MKPLSELIKDGFTVLEEHEQERLETGGTIGAYVLLQTPDGRKYLTQRDSNSYVKVISK